MRGRSRRRISSTSRKPRVVITPMRAPLRSSSALVPTVVPWTIEPMSVDRSKPLQPLDEPDRLVAAMRWRLGGGETPLGFVEPEEVGEGSADIDANDGRRIPGVPLKAGVPRASSSWRPSRASPSASTTTRYCSRAAWRRTDSRAAGRGRPASDRLASGSPQPPPPGVSSLTRWPRSNLDVRHFRGERRRVPRQSQSARQSD